MRRDFFLHFSYGGKNGSGENKGSTLHDCTWSCVFLIACLAYAVGAGAGTSTWDP
jgi:hypothetical protein